MAFANKTHLKIITPNGIFWDKEVDMVTVRTTEGEMGILHGKSPVVASIEISELSINKRGSSNFKDCAIAGGILYVTPERIDIITDAIEYKEKIDITRAERAKKLAEQMLRQKQDETEQKLAELALKRAMNRIDIKRG